MIRNPTRISSFYRPSLFTSIHLLKKGSSSSYPSLRITYPCCPSRFKLLKAVLGESIPTPCRKGRLDLLNRYTICPSNITLRTDCRQQNVPVLPQQASAGSYGSYPCKQDNGCRTYTPRQDQWGSEVYPPA